MKTILTDQYVEEIIKDNEELVSKRRSFGVNQETFAIIFEHVIGYNEIEDHRLKIISKSSLADYKASETLNTHT